MDADFLSLSPRHKLLARTLEPCLTLEDDTMDTFTTFIGTINDSVAQLAHVVATIFERKTDNDRDK